MWCWKSQNFWDLFESANFLESKSVGIAFWMKAISWNGNIWFKQVDHLSWRKEGLTFLGWHDINHHLSMNHNENSRGKLTQRSILVFSRCPFLTNEIDDLFGGVPLDAPSHRWHWFWLEQLAAKIRSQWWEHPLEQRISVISISRHNTNYWGKGSTSRWFQPLWKILVSQIGSSPLPR